MRPVDAETSSPALPRSGVRLGVETDSAEVGQRGHGARLWGKLGQPKKYSVYL